MASAKKQLLPDWMLLFVFSVVEVMLTVAVPKSDTAVASSWPNNPYSPVWFLLNPFGDTQAPYHAWLAMFQAVAFGLMIIANRWYGLPFKVAFMNLAVNMVWLMIGWDENVTVTAFAWAAWFAWPFLLFPFLQKIPIWWPPLDNAHVRCLFQCFNPALLQQEQGWPWWQQLLDRDLLHLLTYVLIILIAIYPVWIRWRMGRKA